MGRRGRAVHMVGGGGGPTGNVIAVNGGGGGGYGGSGYGGGGGGYGQPAPQYRCTTCMSLMCSHAVLI